MNITAGAIGMAVRLNGIDVERRAATRDRPLWRALSVQRYARAIDGDRLELEVRLVPLLPTAVHHGKICSRLLARTFAVRDNLHSRALSSVDSGAVAQRSCRRDKSPGACHRLRPFRLQGRMAMFCNLRRVAAMTAASLGVCCAARPSPRQS